MCSLETKIFLRPSPPPSREQLLSRIAGAASAEDLRKVHAEIEAALGLQQVPDTEPDSATEASATSSGLTPNVAELHVNVSKHL